MFGLLSRRMLLRHQMISNRQYCTKPLKFLKDKQLRYESKLMAIKEFVLKENMETNGNINWKKLVSKLSEQQLINKINFEVDLMSAFILNDGTDTQMDEKLFESMVKLIKGVPNVLNNSIAASRYCHFISHFHQYIEESDIEMIRRTTDQLMSKYMDNRLTTDVLYPSLIGLSKSSKTNCLYSIKLLDQLKQIDFKLIQQIMDSALNFRLIDQTLDLIEKYSDIRLSEAIVSKIIVSLTEINPKVNQTIKLFQTLSKTLVIFDSDLKPKLIEIMKRLSYKTTLTSIGQNGLCLKCDQILSGVKTEEQNTLNKVFRSVIFNKENDLMLKSFPEFEREFKNFNKFMRKITSRRPLDLVIDGLNLAFFINPIVVEDTRNRRQYVQKYPTATVDTNVVQILTSNNIDKYENVLIVGRNHMKNWKQLNQLLERHSERISMFYAMNKTQDDCYILYAALQDPNTYLISTDFYRDYCEKMSINGLLFQRWLKTHQVLALRNKKQFIFPDRFDHKIHISEDDKTIHIPFSTNDSSKIDWICFQKS